MAQLNQTSFPTEFRALRQRAGLTQSQIAEKSRVSRRTIIRWEAGEVSPWIPELKAVLAAMLVSDVETEHLLSGLKTPRGSKAAGNPQPDLVPGFIRMARLRSGLSIRHVAQAVGFDPSTINRWENGSLAPSSESFELICRTFDVSPEEEALASDPAQWPSTPSPAEIEEEIEGIVWPWDPMSWVLYDVRFLSLLANLNSQRVGADHLAPFKAQAHWRYAEKLSRCGRLDEARTEAKEALSICEEESAVHPQVMHFSTLILARCQFRRPRWRQAKEGLQLLDGLESRPLDLEQLFERMSLYSEWNSHWGANADARRYALEAAALVRERPELHRVGLTRIARVLLHSGDPRRALEIMPPVGEDSPATLAEDSVLLATILEAIGRSSDSSHWKTVAKNQIEAYNLQPLFEHRTKRKEGPEGPSDR